MMSDNVEKKSCPSQDNWFKNNEMHLFTNNQPYTQIMGSGEWVGMSIRIV